MSEKKEYITKDEAISAIHTGFWTDIRIDKNIQAIPAADVEPVVRGTWKESFTTRDCQYAPSGVIYTFWYTCSNCGKKSRTKHERCLKCFAHMERSGSGE